jgi:hypothetical protein
MTTNEQTFKNFYQVAYVSNKYNQIELSINQFLFTLENDNKADCCNVFDTFTGEFLTEIACYKFDTELSINDYPNDLILEYIVTNLIEN